MSMSTEKRAAPNVAQVKFERDVPSDSQSFTALNILKNAISKCQDNTIVALTENDYEQLIVLLGELTDVVREDENHFFAPLMEFVVVLIEKYDHAHNPELASRIQKDRVQNASNTENDLVAG